MQESCCGAEEGQEVRTILFSSCTLYIFLIIFIHIIIEEILTILCSARATRTEHVELQAIEKQKVQRRRRRRKKIDVAVVIM